MKKILSEDAMKQYGRMIGLALRGGEVIELIGDLGAGKTTFTKGLGAGLEIDEDVQSPSFTISREYDGRDGLKLHHYDFYRLSDPGIVKFELSESVSRTDTVTVVEWAQTAYDALPDPHIVLRLNYEATGEGRAVDVTLPAAYDYLREVIL